MCDCVDFMKLLQLKNLLIKITSIGSIRGIISSCISAVVQKCKGYAVYGCQDASHKFRLVQNFLQANHHFTLCCITAYYTHPPLPFFFPSCNSIRLRQCGSICLTQHASSVTSFKIFSTSCPTDFLVLSCKATYFVVASTVVAAIFTDTMCPSDVTAEEIL